MSESEDDILLESVIDEDKQNTEQEPSSNIEIKDENNSTAPEKTEEEIDQPKNLTNEEERTNENNGESCNDAKDIIPSISCSKENIEQLLETDVLDEKTLTLQLEKMSTEELNNVFNHLTKTNHNLLKENEIYDFILNEDENVRDTLDSIEVEEDQMEQDAVIFSNPLKCYFANMKIAYIEKELNLEKYLRGNEIQNLKFKLESLNTSIKDVKEAKEKFIREIRIGGRHQVTKKVILQKVAKHFNDSIQNKMALTNRYKIQAQSDTMERNKILSQIKAQEKRLASLDITEYQKTEFEYMKSCRTLTMLKKQLGKFKMKFSPLLMHITEMKKNLEKEEMEMERMQKEVSKLEHLKEVMITEKNRNDEKLLELKSEMRKIKLDPRRHNLPEVIDYAAAKKENAAVKKGIQKWKQKVELVQQEKSLYLKALSKKKL